MRHRASPLLTLLGLLLACGESDPQPLELIRTDHVFGAQLAGGASSHVVALSYARLDAPGALRLLRHDPAAPDALEVVEELPGYTALAVTPTVAAALDGAGLVLIDLTSPSLARSAPIPLAPERLAVEGRWLLAQSERSLTLVDREAPEARTTFVATSPVTALLRAPGAFLAFTTSGYVHVTPGATPPVFREVSDPELRNLAEAFADGAGAIAGGPAATLGRSRVVRLDLSAPGSPTILRSHEVEGTYRGLAWDGARTTVIAVERGLFPSFPSEGYVVREEGGAFTSAGTPLPYWNPGDRPRLVAHADRLFTLSSEGFSMFRIR